MATSVIASESKCLSTILAIIIYFIYRQYELPYIVQAINIMAVLFMVSVMSFQLIRLIRTGVVLLDALNAGKVVYRIVKQCCKL